jgi:aminoglycoside 3-N-acetyltransferase
MSEAEVINQTSTLPVTSESLKNDLLALGVQPGSVLIVHSSMSKLGWVCGGAPAVILGLETALGSQGTLVMPTHSGDLSDPEAWSNPPVPAAWWELIRQTMPAYDPDLTPTRGMGVIPETFRKQPGVLRSMHPQGSFAARGPLATIVTSDHPVDCPFGEHSPLAHLYDLDAFVLLLGVGHENNTSLHLAEDRASYSGKTFSRRGAPVMVNELRQWVWFDSFDESTDDFAAIGDDFERESSLVRRGMVGYATTLLFRQRPLVDFAVQWMNNHRK